MIALSLNCLKTFEKIQKHLQRRYLEANKINSFKGALTASGCGVNHGCKSVITGDRLYKDTL